MYRVSTGTGLGKSILVKTFSLGRVIVVQAISLGPAIVVLYTHHRYNIYANQYLLGAHKFPLVLTMYSIIFILCTF